MKSRTFFSIVMYCLFYLILQTFAIAGEADNESNLDATVSVGVIMIDSSNNLSPNGSKAIISDLYSSPKNELFTLPVLLPKITYDIGERDGLKLYFNTRPEIDAVGGFAFNFGGNYQIKDIATIDISTFINPFDEVWEDPYLTGTAREETKTSKYGVILAFKNILGTGLSINAAYMNDEIDNDVIGSRVPELARDGSMYVVTTNYSYHLSKTFELRPSLSLIKGDYDGESNTYSKVKMELEARHRVGRFMLIPSIYYSYSEYDEINPLFNQTREDDEYGVKIVANYFAPFGMRNWSVQTLTGYSKGASNITFYDTEAITFGVFCTYKF